MYPKPNPSNKNKLFLCWAVEFSFFLRSTAVSAMMVIMGRSGSKIPTMMHVM